MLKKFLAVLSALALGLGMAVVTALPAAAHHTTISADVVCSTDDGTYKVTWRVQNSESDKWVKIRESSDESLVPTGTKIDAGKTAEFVEYFDAPTSKTLELKGEWKKGEKQTNSGSISESDFPSDCEPPVDECVVVAWEMPSWEGRYHATWPQQYVMKSDVVECDHSKLGILDGVLTQECGTQFQVDLYYNSATTAALINGQVLHGSNDPAEDLFPGGWGKSYKLVNTPECIEENAVASATVAPPTCDAPGSVEFVIEHAEWDAVPPETPGEHTVTATAHDGHAFPGGGTTLEVKYTIEAQLEGLRCAPPEPTWVEEECSPTDPFTVTSASYSVTPVEGITYFAKVGYGSWTEVTSAGPHEVAVGLAGTTVKVRAVDGSGEFIDEWTHKFKNQFAFECFIAVYPVEPEVTNEVCDAENAGQTLPGGYTIIPADNVAYSVLVEDIWEYDVEPGFHEVPVGTTFKIAATPSDLGYYIPGVLVKKWFGPYTIEGAGDCRVEVVVGDPVSWVDVCDADGELDQGFSIVAVDHVNYTWTLNGVEKGAIEPGAYGAGPDDVVVITAHADPGYVLDGPYSWEYTFNPEGSCDLTTEPLVTPEVKFTQLGCEADGSYTLSTVEGAPGSVFWTVNGGTPFTTTGTFEVDAPGEVTITAEAAEGYGFAGEEPVLEWSYTYVEDEACGDLDTLALTGGSAAAGLGLAGAFLLAGALVVMARRRQNAEV